MANVSIIPEVVSAEEAPAGEQWVNLLREHEEIETIVLVILGLFVTSRLQLRGANALLVNLGVASVLRQIFRQIKKESAPVVAPSAPKAHAWLGPDVSIVHSPPGRLRLRLGQLQTDPGFAKRLERRLEREDCVVETRVNRASGSAVILYEAASLSELELGMKLLAALQDAR